MLGSRLESFESGFRGLGTGCLRLGTGFLGLGTGFIGLGTGFGVWAVGFEVWAGVGTGLEGLGSVGQWFRRFEQCWAVVWKVLEVLFEVWAVGF